MAVAAIGGGVHVAVMKGRRNYLCLQRLDERLDLLRHQHGAAMDEVRVWADRTDTGDVADAPSPSIVSEHLTVSSDDCLGRDCPFYDDCLFERAKARAAEAHIVVSNCHLPSAPLAVRESSGADKVLPPFDIIVIDEAHETADIARTFFGFSLSQRAFARPCNELAEHGLREAAQDVRNAATEFFRALRDYRDSTAYHVRLRRRGVLPAEPLLAAIRTATTAIANAPSPVPSRIGTDLTSLAERVALADSADDADRVTWLEPDGVRTARIESRLVHVGPRLRAALFDQVESAILVSATLTTCGSFAWVRRELGVPETAREVEVSSPFDFERCALLVVPDGMPEPNTRMYDDASAGVLRHVIDACGGRTLGLFTSFRALELASGALADCRYRVLTQSEGSRTALVEAFREEESSVLLGVDSFWTGVDVPGDALRAVVIDRLPFPHPEDPLLDALGAGDRMAFERHVLPRAVIKFRQGVGRLIRSTRDYGVIVVCDPRIATKPYGRRFLRALPKMPSSRRLGAVTQFLQEVQDERIG